MLKSLALSIMLLAPAALFAQSNMQDAIYLKDGSIYKGVIIEQVPNVSYKIQSKDGNTYAVTVDEVEKITKEKKPYERPASYGPWGGHGGHWGYWNNDTTSYMPKEKGYFFEAQVLIENVQGGLRAVSGYKFNRYAYLGVGIGVDFLMSNPFNSRVNGLDKKELAGTYPSLYLYFASDGPTRGRFTPFMALEGGYTVAFKKPGDADYVDDFGNRISGGPMAGFGLGFKVKSRHKRAHLSVLFNVNYKQLNYEYDRLFVNSTGTVTGSVTEEAIGHIIVPGIRLGFGF